MLMRRSMRADEDAVPELFGKNMQVKRAFRWIFAAFAGLVPARVPDPAAAHTILAAITGTGT
jgi:hypothetical protein